MNTAILSPEATRINWSDVIEYPQSGAKGKLLLEDKNCRYTLMSLAASASIASHANPRNATVNVIEGQGILTLETEEISLELGVFAFIPASVRHSLKAITDLTFLLTLSEMVNESSY